MAVTPDVLHGAAEDLSNGREEVDWRNAVSRAYYARVPLGANNSRSKSLLGSSASKVLPRAMRSSISPGRLCMDTRRPTADVRKGP